MARPQEDIFAEGSTHHAFLEYSIGPGVGLGSIRGALTTAKASVASESHRVIAFGASLWARLGGVQPAGPRAFDAIQGKGGSAPATQRDLFVWVHGGQRGAVFDRAAAAQHALRVVASLELEEIGFTYHDSRDLTGFVDGSANPTGDAIPAAALVPAGQPAEAGSFVLGQRWIHDLDAFAALSVADQERVIGRTKPDSIELEGDAMPSDSHVSRTDHKEDGVAMKIYRRSAPFGGVSVAGLYFLAFACDLHRFDVLLARMFGTSGDELCDRLMAYSKPVTGSYWFAPSRDALEEVL